MSIRIHLCACIDGLLRSSNRELNGLFTNDDGISLSASGARKYLCEQKAMGRRVIPMGECDNFDYQRGCRGHEIVDAIEPSAEEGVGI